MKTLPFPASQPKHSVKTLIILVRADPIICGHSTEARNLAEAAIELGIEKVHIVSYPLHILENSDLPLKPLHTIQPYSKGISIDRPEPIGNYKVLDGRIGHGISGHLVDLLHRLPGPAVVMDLYLVPHGQMVINAIRSFEAARPGHAVTTIAEAVGSDITNIVSNAVEEGRFGAAQMVLTNYLDHDLPVAVSEFTKAQILESAVQVDEALGTNFTERLAARVQISFPAIDTAAYTAIDHRQDAIDAMLNQRGLKRDGYLMFLSRVAPAKGVDDLIHAYRDSRLYGRVSLLICGNGTARDEMIELAGGDPNIRFLDDVGDDEKGLMMHACHAYCLPSKARPEFVETFGIAVAEKMLAGGPGPVITTRTGGIPEATGGHCLEHKAADVDELRACLDRLSLMSEAERIELSQKARAFALQFDRSNVLSRLLEHAPLARAA